MRDSVLRFAIGLATGRGRSGPLAFVLTVALTAIASRFIHIAAGNLGWTPSAPKIESDTFVLVPIAFWPAIGHSPIGPALAFPAAWLIFSATVRRLRDLEWNERIALVTFAPVFSIVALVVLAISPRLVGMPASQTRPVLIPGPIGRCIPREDFLNVTFAVLVSGFLCIGGTWFGTSVLGDYGWTVFVGLPFATGFICSIIVGFHESRSFGSCLAVTLVACLVNFCMLLSMQMEGLICLLMGSPLLMPIAFFGAWFGYIVQRRPTSRDRARPAFAVLVLPFLAMGESAVDTRPPLIEASTSIIVDAPPEFVWKNVVNFSDLPEPKEWLFQTGVAYPIRATITGNGVGAVRYCEFSTGRFVEPIEVWDEPRLLRFAVTENPPVMREANPYGEIHPPHLRGFFVSERGQFELHPMPGRRTLLVGTTWYRHRIEPQVYWSQWSNAIVHAVHSRVLRHIKTLSEGSLID